MAKYIIKKTIVSEYVKEIDIDDDKYLGDFGVAIKSIEYLRDFCDIGKIISDTYEIIRKD